MFSIQKELKNKIKNRSNEMSNHDILPILFPGSHPRAFAFKSPPLIRLTNSAKSGFPRRMLKSSTLHVPVSTFPGFTSLGAWNGSLLKISSLPFIKRLSNPALKLSDIRAHHWILNFWVVNQLRYPFLRLVCKKFFNYGLRDSFNLEP